MGSNYCEPGRRGMTVSVVILGIAVASVMFAYLAFGDDTDEYTLRNLRMIQVVFRHGSRNPTELYPNDPHIHHHFPGGLGALTNKGSQQMYNLGKNMNLRYYRLLPSNGFYSKEDISVQSSYAERCQMSAQSFLAGFMPPLENKNPLPVVWQPVPVNPILRDQDKIIAQKMSCPKYEDALRKLYNSPPPEIQELNKLYAKLYTSLSRNTGQNISSARDVESLYNILDTEQSGGLMLPDWTEGVFPDKMLNLAERSLAMLTETPYMKKVKGGVLFSELLDNMIKKRNQLLEPNRNIFIYSGHDVTLVSLMRALGIIDQTANKPDYAATLVFELHNSITYADDFEVKIFYYFDSADKYPKELQIPKCDAPCSLTQFQKATSWLFVKSYNETCGIS